MIILQSSECSLLRPTNQRRYLFALTYIWNHRFLVPKGCDLVAASALPVAYGTSHVGLVHRARLNAGQVGGSSCFSH